MNSYTIGLDIGIASVGFGVIDDKDQIVEAGVRLYPEADVSNNEGRRAKRSSRRLQRRRKHRIDRTIELLKKNGFSEDRSDGCPYHLRVKGLHNKLQEEELVTALTHLVKRRGIHNVDASDLDEDDMTNELSTKEQIQKNDRLLRTKYIAEIQLERLLQEGEVRGSRNRFPTKAYLEEAEAILFEQQKHEERITNGFIDDFLGLLETRRTYYEGPGEGSPYGWDQDIEVWYKKMMGFCSYFPEEVRSVKTSPSAEMFNLLNDLNNLNIMREENTKLTKEEKEVLVKEVFQKVKEPKLKHIAKTLKLNEKDIRGYRVKKNGTAEFTPLTFYYTLSKIDPALAEIDIDLQERIAEIATIWQEVEEKEEQLKDLNLSISDKKLQQLSQINFTKTHALSLKAIRLLLPDLWDTSKNQMQLFTDHGLKPRKVPLEGRKLIPDEYVEELILSPVVKRSFTQSIRVLNALIKKYGEPAAVVIELARENNSQDQKRFLNKLQKENEALNKKVREALDEKNLKTVPGIFQKLRLWHLQEGKCLYSHKAISLENLLEKPTHYEVDHIIPRSVSFDDSQANKVLVLMEENQKKGNRTPYQYLKSGDGVISYEAYQAHILQLAKSKEKMPRKKQQYLLEERDINKYNVQKEFINRNLVDTRYATRELYLFLTSYFEANNKAVKIKTINGSFTNYLRKLWRFSKDREEDHKHHAEDALIAAMGTRILAEQKEMEVQNKLLEEGSLLDEETGEVLNEKDFDAAFTNKYFKIQAIKNYQDFKYSRRVDQKPNRQLMNDTLYSTREYGEEEFIINKISNLYDPKSEELKKKFEKDPTVFLMYDNDPKTFENLETIMNRYADAKNPLAAYEQEEGKKLHKYSKKQNGPLVKSLKYRGKKLGTHKDLSGKYKGTTKRVVALSLKSFRMDVYQDNEKYKFVSITYDDLQEVENGYVIPKETYTNKLKKKGISSEAGFLFTLYEGNYLKLNGEEYRFIGVNNDTTNRIEVDLINKKSVERNMPSIGNKIKGFEKLNVNCIGDVFSTNRENLKMYYPKKF